MYRVLLVDDEPIVKVGLRKLLEGEGDAYPVVGTASSGVEALRFTEANPVDILITDLKMPGMDGIDLIKNLKVCGFAGVILVLSNYSDFELVREALTVGAFDYLLKVSITRETLLRQIEKAADCLEQTRRGQQYAEERESLLKKQQRQLSVSELRDMLLTCKNSGTALHTAMPAHKIKPSFFAIVTFFASAAGEQKLLAALHHTHDLIAEIFKDVGDIVTLQTDATELIILVPARPPCETSTAFLQRMQQLVRQSSIYFSLTPEIVCAPLVLAFAQLGQSYLQCLARKGISFYMPACAVFETKHCTAHTADGSALYEKLIADSLTALSQQDIHALDTAASTYVQACTNLTLLPRIALQNAGKAVDVIGSAFYLPEIFRLSPEFAAKFPALTSVQALGQWLREVLYAMKKQEACSNMRPEIQNVVIFIHQHYREKLELDDIAAAARLNKSYLCRVFKAEMHMNIFQYINQIRMEKAAQLLRQSPNAYIKEIAALVGVEDPFYFTRKFKEYFGVSPSEFC